MKRISLLILFFLLFFPQITIKANEKPKNTHIVNYANPTPLQEIKNRYYAYDFVDGNITNKLFFDTNYHELTCKIGTYYINVSVTNSQNKTTIFNDEIIVRDFVSPKIELISDFIIYDKSTSVLSELLQKVITFEDNLDDKPYLIEYTLHDDICDFYCFDSSLNQSNTLSIKLQITESIKSIVTASTITLNQTGISKTEIIDLFLKENNIDHNYQNVSVSSDYFEASKNGIYKAKISLTYEDCIITYHFKIKLEIKTSKTKSHVILLPILAVLIIALLIIYKKRTNYSKH